MTDAERQRRRYARNKVKALYGAKAERLAELAEATAVAAARISSGIFSVLRPMGYRVGL